MVAGYVILVILGILMFFSLFIVLGLFIYSFRSEKRKDEKERECAPYHEAGHVTLAMATGMGFEKVSIAGNSHNFGFMSHQKIQYARTRNGSNDTLREIDQRELLENALMTALAGYVAEMLTCGKTMMPSSTVKYGDMEAVNDILQANPFLYTEINVSPDGYLESLIARTRDILIQESGLHLAVSHALIERNELTEQDVWVITGKEGLTRHLHNPYACTGFSLDLSSS